MVTPRKRLGEILIERRLVTEEQLRECLDQQKLTKEYLGSILINKKIVKEEDLMKALSAQFNIPYISLKTQYIDWGVCSKFSYVVRSQDKALPIRQDDLSVTVAISDPLDVLSISKFEELAKPKRLKLVLVSHSELKEFINECKKRTRGSVMDLLNREGNV